MAGDEPSEDDESDAGEDGGEHEDPSAAPDEPAGAEPTDPEDAEPADAGPGDTESEDEEPSPDSDDAPPSPGAVEGTGEVDAGEDVTDPDSEADDGPDEGGAENDEPGGADERAVGKGGGGAAGDEVPTSEDAPGAESGAEVDAGNATPGDVDDDPDADSPEAPMGDEDADVDSVGPDGPDPSPVLDAGTGAEESVEPADEAPPLSPGRETDPDVDPPAPVDAGEVEPAVDDPGAAAGFDEEPDASAGSVAEVGPDAADTGGGVLGGGRSGPAEDREMPLAEHIREMLKRLAVVVAVAGLVSLLVFPFAERIINFLWYSILPGVESEIARPRLYGVLELLFTELKVASLAGLIVALPVLVYEAYAFMRPGLYPHERRYYLAAIPTSLVLALVGVSFAYFVVLPVIFLYFLEYSQDVATIGFALGRTFDLILLLMGYMAIVFQIPLFIMLAMMMGLTSRQWLADRRLLFWGAFLGISFLFSPDPTGMAPIMVAATMILLFEGTLLLTKWTGRG